MNTDDVIIAHIKNVVVPPLRSVLEKHQEELREHDITVFSQFVSPLMRRALDELCVVAGVLSLADLSIGVKVRMLICILSEFNSVLPLDHPYILAGIYIEDEQQTVFSVLQRSMVPGYKELVYTNSVPIYFIQTRSQTLDLQSHIKKVEFFGPNDDSATLL
jgi:hypothetical protein